MAISAAHNRVEPLDSLALLSVLLVRLGRFESIPFSVAWVAPLCAYYLQFGRRNGRLRHVLEFVFEGGG